MKKVLVYHADGTSTFCPVEEESSFYKTTDPKDGVVVWVMKDGQERVTDETETS